MGTTYTFSSVSCSQLFSMCFTVTYSPPVPSDQPELASPHHRTYGSSMGLLASYDASPHMKAPLAGSVSPAACPTQI